MQRPHGIRSGFAWMELLLGLAAIALLFQFYPALFHRFSWVVDLRNWSQLTFFLMNVVVVLVLVGVRFGSDWKESWEKSGKGHRKIITMKRAKKGKSAEEKDLKKERETIKRIIEGRSRRIY